MKAKQCKELVDTVMYAHENYMDGYECSAVDLLNYLEREETVERRLEMYEFFFRLTAMTAEVVTENMSTLRRCAKCGELLLLEHPDVWLHVCDPK